MWSNEAHHGPITGSSRSSRGHHSLHGILNVITGSSRLALGTRVVQSRTRLSRSVDESSPRSAVHLSRHEWPGITRSLSVGGYRGLHGFITHITGSSRAHHGLITVFAGSSRTSRGHHGWHAGRAWYKKGHDADAQRQREGFLHNCRIAEL